MGSTCNGSGDWGPLADSGPGDTQLERSASTTTKMGIIMNMKDFAEVSMYIVTTIGAPIAALWALLQWRETLQQRKIEFRWRQADLGRRLLDQLFDEPVAGVALELIDGELEFIETPEEGKVVVDNNSMIKALSSPKDNTAGSRQIRRSFDALLFYLERLESMINLKLIEQDDIAMPTKYYCQKMKTYMETITSYAIETGYGNALNLIKRLQNADHQL